MDYEETKKDVEDKVDEARSMLRRVRDYTILSETLVELFNCLASGTANIYLPKLGLPEDAVILAIFPSNRPSQYDGITLRIWSATFEPLRKGDIHENVLLDGFAYSELYQKVTDEKEESCSNKTK